jgi:hypothetical protein
MAVLRACEERPGDVGIGENGEWERNDLRYVTEDLGPSLPLSFTDTLP